MKAREVRIGGELIDPLTITYDELVRKMVDTLPPLTPEGKADLAVLLRGRDGLGEAPVRRREKSSTTLVTGTRGYTS